LWDSYLDVDVGAKISHGLFCISAQRQVAHRAEYAFFVCALSTGFVVPAKHPNIGAVFTPLFQEASFLKAAHAVLLA
jgi:hypothetical protein